MIAKLAAALHAIGNDLTGEELADILWLALQIEQVRPSLVAPMAQMSEQLPEFSTSMPSSLPIAASPSPPPPSSPLSDTAIYPQTHTTRKEPEVGKPVTPVKLSGATALPGSLGLVRVLRPLNRRVASHMALVTEVKATAERVAEEGILEPVLSPAPERWLDVALVVDIGASMVIWQKTIAELHHLLVHQSAFRDVRIWELLTDAVDGVVRLYAGTGASGQQRTPRNIKELSAPNGRRLIIVVSDCISTAWHNGTVARVLATWGKTTPITIMQMLPQRLWPRTALKHEVEVYLSGRVPGVPNSRLTCEIRNMWVYEAQDPRPMGFPVPVVTLEPWSLKAWVKVLVGAPDTRISGFILDTNRREAPPPRGIPEHELTAEQCLQRFRSNASPLALELARLLAAAPVSLPVIRIIQQQMLPKSQQIHAAEVLLGGLLQRSSGSKSSNPDCIQFEFFNGVRELLLETVPQSHSEEVIQHISEFIAQHQGLPHDFSALIADPAASDKLWTLGINIHAFARIRSSVLRTLGYDRVEKTFEQPHWPFCRRRILVVENDPVVRSDHVLNLKRWSFEPIIAEGQGEALLIDAERKARQHRCHLALVDMRLLDDYDRTDTSGLDLVPRLKPTVSIIVSGHGDRASVVKALRDRQAIDFVGKEEGPVSLRKAIDEAIHKICTCSLQIQWQPPDEPVDVLRQLRLYDPDIPRDELPCVLGRLYVQEKISRLTLRPVTTYYHSPEKFTPHERSAVMVARIQGDDGEWRQAEIIKLTLRERIENEIQNYHKCVAPYLSPRRTARIEDKKNAVVFWDIGAVRYTNIAAENRQPLRQWYMHATVDDVKSALNDLFHETLGPWYRRTSPQKDDTVYGYYMRLFASMEKRMMTFLQQYEGREYVSIPGVPYQLRNPVLWARRRGQSSFFVSHWDVYTHGDLHGDNIFVDQHNQTSIIDYERSGPGYILRDFVELEVDIRLRQLILSPDHLELAFHLDLLLLAPHRRGTLPVWQDIPGANKQIQAELRKAFEVICEIRRLVVAMTRCDMDEYYWALLMETLISVVRNYASWQNQQTAQFVRTRALLAAALLCERLEHWSASWPSEAWSQAINPSPDHPRIADMYTAYETGIQHLLNRLGQQHKQYSDALVYQTRLLDNIKRARRYGDDEENKAERYEIIDRLNILTLSTLNISFSELCHQGS